VPATPASLLSGRAVRLVIPRLRADGLQSQLAVCGLGDEVNSKQNSWIGLVVGSMLCSLQVSGRTGVIPTVKAQGQWFLGQILVCVRTIWEHVKKAL
jgi:hypothetical protein